MISRMALAKEQQRLHKKTIIARVCCVTVRIHVVECGAYPSCCCQEDRGRYQGRAVERGDEGSQGRNPPSETEQESQLTGVPLVCFVLFVWIDVVCYKIMRKYISNFLLSVEYLHFPTFTSREWASKEEEEINI